MAINQLEGKLSNVQLELMKLFATDVSDDELIQLKNILLKFKFKRVADLADQFWDEKGWTDQDMENILNTHLRTPYQSQKKDNTPDNS